MFFSSVALSLMAPALCLGWPVDYTAFKRGSSKHKMEPCKNGSSFNLLTYNVAGLPEIINRNGIEDKDGAAASIGLHLREEAYDVVHLQEDFHLHDRITTNDNHTYQTFSSGDVMDGDGLNTFSWYNCSIFDRYTWKECAINGGDCLTPKGFTYMTSHIDGLEVDLYNLHADAGNQWPDRLARSEGIDQLLRHIKKHSNGRPVILAGDFNDVWTHPKRTINKLTDAGFTDAWVKLHHNGTIPENNGKSNGCAHPPQNNSCEVVDKVFYRSGKFVHLDAVKFNYESEIFVTKYNSPLSDHAPVRVDFAWFRKAVKDLKEVKEPKMPEEAEEPEQSEQPEKAKEAKKHKGMKKPKEVKKPKQVKKPQQTEKKEKKEKTKKVEEPKKSEDPKPILYPMARGA
ncbi:Endo/exonuclease/phosphatase domain-containing protein [Fusarium keratoplasticum]|nr:Endo/exonuclease/phosphatase domain-containing protein [Fusarium keratoplasticum]